MRILILGAGLMARGALHDYLRSEDVQAVTVADASQAALDAMERRFADDRVTYVQFDASDRDTVARLMRDADGAFSAIHYGFNEMFTECAIEAGTHMVDLGGNNDVVSAQRTHDAAAVQAGVSIVPDCGLAPGWVSVLTALGLDRLPWADSVRIRVGGLPLNPQQPLRYERLFSVEGLINEYVEPPVLMREGEIVTAEPLGDIERVEFDAPLGTLEAFNTSGGVSTLPESFAGRVRNLDYKTLRYPGHAEAMQWLYRLGLFSSEPVDVDGVSVVPRRLVADAIVRAVPESERDRTVVRIEFSGMEDGVARMHRLQVIDEFDEATALTSMMRMTAFPAAIISQMQCRGEVLRPGVQPQELAVDPDAFVDEFTARGVRIEGVEALRPTVGSAG